MTFIESDQVHLYVRAGAPCFSLANTTLRLPLLVAAMTLPPASVVIIFACGLHGVSCTAVQLRSCCASLSRHPCLRKLRQGSCHRPDVWAHLQSSRHLEISASSLFWLDSDSMEHEHGNPKAQASSASSHEASASATHDFRYVVTCGLPLPLPIPLARYSVRLASKPGDRCWRYRATCGSHCDTRRWQHLD